MSAPRPFRAADSLGDGSYTNVEELADVIAERVGDRVLERLQHDSASSRPALLDVAGVARLLDVSADYVRAHRDALGAVRLPGAVLRFDPAVIAERLSVRCSSEKPDPAQSPAEPGSSYARRRRRTGATPDLLPIKGGGA